MHTYIHIYGRACVCLYECMSMSECMCVCARVCAYVNGFICMGVSICLFMNILYLCSCLFGLHICIYEYVDVCVYNYVFICKNVDI